MGSVGRDYLIKARPQLHFTYLELPDDDAPLAHYKPLLDRLKDFDHITVSYGRFVNVVEQVPTRVSLVGSLPVASQSESGQRETQADRPRDYLFEPSLPAVLTFFDTYIFAVLFQQTVNESGLAQLGSRITAMEQASQNIDERLKRLQREHLSYQRALRNQKQRERLAGMVLWKA